MHCPTCRKELYRHDAPMPDGATVLIDRCAASPSCGVWYDARELPALHARFYDDSVRRALFDSVRTSMGESKGSRVCPACEERGKNNVLTPIRFVGVELDVCEYCQGVWVDRKEMAGLLSALPLYVPGEGSAVATTYRTAPSAQVMKHGKAAFVRCVRCKAESAYRDAALTENGFMCIACANGMNDSVDEAHSSFWNRLKALVGAS